MEQRLTNIMLLSKEGILYQEHIITYSVPGLKALDTVNLVHRTTYIVPMLKVPDTINLEHGIAYIVLE